jgi:hypothetical protein
MSQYILGPDDWEELIPLVMYYINTKPIPALKNMCPLDICSRRDKHSNPLFKTTTEPTLVPVLKGKHVKEPKKKQMVLMYVYKLAVIFDAVDKVVYEVREDKRRVARNGGNQRLKPEFLQWGIGEWVMYSTIKAPIKKDKMRKR